MISHPFLIMIALIAIMIGVSVIDYYRRRNAAERFALENGFEYQKESDAGSLGVKGASFYQPNNSFYYNVVSGSLQPDGDTGQVPLDPMSDKARPVPFTYFELDAPGRGSNQSRQTESIVCFEVPEASLRPAQTVRFAGLDVLGYSIETLDNRIFVWQSAKLCPPDGIGDFLHSAYSACRCQWDW